MNKQYQILKEFIKEELRVACFKQIIREAIGDEEVPPLDPNQNQQPEQEPEQQPDQQQPQQNQPQPNVFSATTEQMADLIRQSRGKIFTCAFIKRSTGKERVLQGRLGVRQYLHGGILPYSPNEKGLIPVFDIVIKQYRMINVSGLTSLKINKNIYVLPNMTF